MLYELFKNIITDLDGLTELSAIQIDESKEQIFNLQFLTFGSLPQKAIIRVAHQQVGEVDEYVERLRKDLLPDQEMNKLILTKLLQSILNDE